MQTIILTLHIVVCVFLVILILLQAGKEGMGVIFGGGNTSVFGSAGAGGVLVKLTTLMAVIFVITSLSYTYATSSRPQSESAVLNVTIEESVAPEADKAAPKMPEGAPAIVPPVSSPVGGDKKQSGAMPLPVPSGEQGAGQPQDAMGNQDSRNPASSDSAKVK
ncbi:MAG: preprotein translocase subunit SecG [Desulfovibrio sp.]|nr:preprotein translocase subunit SecG [Desulfovibrio sp.]